MSATTSFAPIRWAQRPDRVYLTIAVAGVKDPIINLSEEKLEFSGVGGADQIQYTANIEFNAAIDPINSKHAVVVGEVQFLLIKKRIGSWPRLTKVKVKAPWLSCDWSKWKDEDDDDANDCDDGGFGVGQVPATGAPAPPAPTPPADADDDDDGSVTFPVHEMPPEMAGYLLGQRNDNAEEEEAVIVAQAQSQAKPLDRGRAVLSAYSLHGKASWTKLSEASFGELVTYLASPRFGARVIVVEKGRFTDGSGCCMYTDGFIITDREWPNKRLALFSDAGALQRYIGEGEGLDTLGLAVAGDTVYGVDGKNRVVALPLAGGHRRARFKSGIENPTGMAVGGGRLYVADDQGRIVAFGRRGAVVAEAKSAKQEGTLQTLRKPTGMCIVGDQLCVTDSHNGFSCSSTGDGATNFRAPSGCVSVFRLPDLTFERHIGVGMLRMPQRICSGGGLLFVTELMSPEIFVFDLVNDACVAVLNSGFGRYNPQGLMAREDVLLVPAVSMRNEWRVYSVLLL